MGEERGELKVECRRYALEGSAVRCDICRSVTPPGIPVVLKVQ